MMPKLNGVVICDLDGTLSDDTHRKAHAKDKDWDRYNSLLHIDHPNPVILTILHSFSQLGHRIILCTARDREFLFPTQDWLEKHAVPYDRLMMRESGDIRSDVEVKKDMIQKIGHPILFVLEDRATVVEMWRECGIQCFQVAKGDY